MRVVLWCTAAVLILSAAVATPAQAGFPPCRDVTEKIPSEYLEGRYLRWNTPTLEQWREWNGYAGLQTQKCETEYGVVLGRDTFVAGTDVTQPGDEVPDQPDLPGPTYPGICRSGDDPNPGDIIAACTEVPTPPSGSDPDTGECAPLPTSALLACLTGDDPAPATAYINWLQYVIGWASDAA